jgi:ERCC4-type nuclease
MVIGRKLIIMIEMDPRERNTLIQSELEKRGVQVVLKTLVDGDYIIRGNEDIQVSFQRMNLEVVTERKAKDFITSLLEDRLDDQLYRCSSKFRAFILILEGYNMMDICINNNIDFETGWSALMGVILKRAFDGNMAPVSVITTQDETETALVLSKMNKKINTDGYNYNFYPTEVKEGKGNTNLNHIVKNIVARFPNTGSKKSEKLLLEFGDLKSIINASIDEIGNIKGISKDWAKDNIISVVEHKYKNQKP